MPSHAAQRDAWTLLVSGKGAPPEGTGPSWTKWGAGPGKKRKKAGNTWAYVHERFYSLDLAQDRGAAIF